MLNSESSPSERTGQTVEIVGRTLYLYGGSYGNSYMTDMHVLEIDPKPEIVKKKLSSKENFIRSVKDFYGNSSLSDVILEIEGKEIHAHRFILSVLSEKFKNMFTCGLSESHNKTIKIKDHKLVYFEYVLNFLYSTEVENEYFKKSWAFDDYIEILKITDEYFVLDLKEYIQSKIIGYVNTDNFSKVYYISKKYKADSLYAFCTWFYRQNKDSLGIELLDETFSDIY